jgi:tetratricopeptide (TPR) repeat protein
MVWHLGRDRRRFVAFLAMFVIMGFGLSLYLNMPDPQPRERHYVFGGMYYAFALWMGLGWTGLVEAVRPRLRLRGWVLAAVAGVGLLLPAGIAAKLYPIQDRTGDYIAYDYGYNLLQSCEENSLLFTNGDNDTFPLWFLQEVEGVRRDVRVINLSLLNTNWYIKQLRDREPKVTIPLADGFIDSVLTDTQLVDLYKRVWPEAKVPKEFRELGLEVAVKAQPGYDLLRVQDFMVIGIVYWNQWRRPVHFAITIPESNRLGLEPYLRMVGMTMRLEPQRELGTDGEALARNLLERYRFRGVKDAAVYKDDNASRLLGNYYACVMALAEWYEKAGRGEELARLFGWAEERLTISWERYYAFGEQLRRVSQLGPAAGYVERAGEALAGVYGRQEGASYENLLALGGMLLNSYGSYDGAERLYRRAVGLAPARWEGYYELAATLQAKGEAPAALELLRRYRTEHGQVDTLLRAEQILARAVGDQAAGTPSQTAP